MPYTYIRTHWPSEDIEYRRVRRERLAVIQQRQDALNRAISATCDRHVDRRLTGFCQAMEALRALIPALEELVE